MYSKCMAVGVAILLGVALVLPAWADPMAKSEEKDWSYPLMPLVDVNEVEPNDVCPGQAINCGDVVHAAISPLGDNDYFYFYVGLAGTVITFGTDADGATPVGDTEIYLYNAQDCTTWLLYNDDGGPGFYSLLSYTAPAPGTYVGRVKAYSGTATTGTYKAFVDCTVIEPPPANDLCSGAIETGLGQINLSGSTRWATNDYELAYPSDCTQYDTRGRDVTYKVEGWPGCVLFMTYTSTADASFYIVTDCADLTTCVAGADVTGAGQPEVIYYTFTSHGIHYIILDSYGTNTWGTWTLVGELNCPTAVDNTSWGVMKALYR